MYNPVSTLRLQFNKDFTLKRAEELIPFFEDLGVRTIYASPIFKATPGSMHGYDVVDPLSINPEIGSEDELVSLSKKLWDKGIGWIQDIVPNHMAFHDDNLWLKDVLEKGERSEYAEFFDNNLASDFYHGAMVPPSADVTVNTSINYRRFFLINGLICLNMQSKKVFDRYHKLIVKLVENGTFKGLRVDHVDGLYDPPEYLRRLRDLVGDETYIVVEKILEPKEELERLWPIQGTTGYEFIAAINNLFTSASAEQAFDLLYESISPQRKSFEERIADSKRMILNKYMRAELDALTQYFIHLGLGNDYDEARNRIAGIMVSFPVYRFYDIKEFSALTKIDNIKFFHRLMQFTGPLMAKGVEDTLMYTFNRFISHNEVGDLPDQFGSSVTTFHHAMIERLEKWPLALNATASHDTKRGEDARMRLNVLTDIPDEWTEKMRHWMNVNSLVRDQYGIDPNDEYMIYQALVGTYPGKFTEEYFERLVAYTSKALREGKVHTRWETPNEGYEKAVVDFISSILRNESEFMKSFVPFVEKVTEHGNINSLSQLVLKITCPGVPDIYQGSLTWDLSFVDPDNRRPVDYEDLSGPKFDLTKKLLHLRSDHEKIFTYGHYYPLKITGPLRQHIIAFGREYQGSWIIVAAMLHTSQIKNFDTSDLKSIDWQDTTVVLPEDCRYENSDHLKAAAIFSEHPVSTLVLQASPRHRRAGILMSVTSLPSHFPIGDIGQSARKFADFLFESRQRIWQMLPVNTIDRESNYSPYSSLSSTEGNPLLICIEDLVAEGLLTSDDIKSVKPWKKNVVDYAEAERIKISLLKKAWSNINDANKIEFEKWIESIFIKQMKSLRKYCNERDIQLVGDIPFYMSQESIDVTLYPEVFSTTEVAGVPPDFFSEDGQLWGMPVYNWNTNKEEVYNWWIRRLKKALDLFDIVRLDHFRAFSEYWSIPAGSESAKPGSWVKGPGIEFFEALKKEVSEFRLIAEDLGDISQDVFDLRDNLKLPGMKVLQFAFGSDFPASVHLPHNQSEKFVVYPGTHDNNTTRGWFENDIGAAEIKNLEAYFNQKVTKNNIAEIFTRAAYASNAQMAIVPMQDVLRLGEKARMNKPSTTTGNWTWRMNVMPKSEIVERLRKLADVYER